MPEEITQAQGFQNVAETWPIYDTLIVCPQFFGQESSNKGWFNDFVAFSQTEKHSFFKDRTESTASLAYCNKQTADTMDFAYEAYSFGVSFFAPGARALQIQPFQPNIYQSINSQLAHWWEVELPRHCSIEFKVQQDTILELPAMAASPGYGIVGGGASFEHERIGRQQPQGVSYNPDYLPVMNMSVTQGVPEIKNRFPFFDPNGQPKPIGIPRTATIEAILTVSEYARQTLVNQINVYPQYIFGGNNDAPDTEGYTTFPARFGIQVSLLGKRLVQQRAQYHR